MDVITQVKVNSIYEYKKSMFPKEMNLIKVLSIGKKSVFYVHIHNGIESSLEFDPYFKKWFVELREYNA